MTDISIRLDPFATDFERSVPHDQFTTRDEEWTSLRSRPAVAFDPVRSQAAADNFRWNHMILRQMSATRFAYIGAGGWAMVPWSDAEKAAERAQFQGRA